jgi:mRNA interferase RelE/StbE
MASYELVFKKSVARDLRELPKKDLQRVLARIRELSANPRPQACEKLSGLPRYRIRQGNYRIVYEIQDQRLVVLIVKVAHRKSVYRA